MTDARAKATFTIGRLFRRQVVNFLDECIFNDLDITYHESKGFLDSDFIIRGKADHVKRVYAAIREWGED